MRICRKLKYSLRGLRVLTLCLLALLLAAAFSPMAYAEGEEAAPPAAAAPLLTGAAPAEEIAAGTDAVTSDDVQPPELLNEPEPAPSETDPAVPVNDTTDVTGKDDKTTELYAQTPGSAYIKEIGSDASATYHNSSALGNAIQQAMLDAVATAAQREDKSATIVVTDGTYEGGVSYTTPASTSNFAGELLKQIIGTGNYDDLMNGLTITIAAEDAFDEDGNLTANSAGGVRVDGQVNIDGVDLVLAGLVFTTNALVDKTTSADIASVTVSGADEFAYYGTAQDDSVSIALNGVTGSANIDTGPGDDTVTVAVTQPAGVSVPLDKSLLDAVVSAGGSLASGNSEEIKEKFSTVGDKISEAFSGDGLTLQAQPLTVRLNGGDGDDRLSARLINSTNFALSYVPDPATQVKSLDVAFGIDLSRTALTIDGGSGNDILGVSGGMNLTYGRSVVNALLNHINEHSSSLKLDSFKKSSATLLGGAGDDEISVDTTTAFSSFFGTDVKADGGESGYDRLHFSGKLEDKELTPELDDSGLTILKDVPFDQRAVLDSSGRWTLRALAEMTFLETLTDMLGNEISADLSFSLQFRRTMLVDTANIDAVTDTLLNKNTVQITAASAGLTPLSFTDYILTPNAGGLVRMTELGYKTAFDISKLPAAGLLLTNLLILYPTDSPIFTADEPVTEITLETVYAPDMDIVVSANKINITGEVTGRDVLLYAYAEDRALLKAGAAIVDDDLSDSADMELEIGVYDVSAKATVTVASGAAVNAAGLVDIAAHVYQVKPLVPDTGLDLNVFTVKLSSAKIDIQGRVRAGGFVHANSAVSVAIDCTNLTLSIVIPVSVALAVTDSSVTVAGTTAIIDAGAGVRLRAATDIKTTAIGRAGLPKFVLAATAIKADTSVSVTNSAQITADGDIELLADSLVQSANAATGKKAGANPIALNPQSGVFISAVALIVDTSSTVGGGARLIADGDIRVESDSAVYGESAAVSIPSNNGAGQVKAKDAIKLATTLLGYKSDSFTGLVLPLNKDIFNGNLTQVLSSVEGADPNKSVTQFAGAVAIGYLGNKNRAEIDALSGSVSADGNLLVRAQGNSVLKVRGDGSLYKSPSTIEALLGTSIPGLSISTESSPDNALGVGLTVSVFDHSNIASVTSGIINSRGIVCEAISPAAAASSIAKAGHVPVTAKAGFGGAVSVQVAELTNTAVLAAKPTYTLSGGEVTVRSLAAGYIASVGDASGKRVTSGLTLGMFSLPLNSTYLNADGAGVGSGIAVCVTQGDVTAVIEDGVSFGGAGISSLTIQSQYSSTERVHAAAGAESGTAIVPVLAVGVSGVYVESTLGTGSALTATGDALISSLGSIERYYEADAAAIGNGVGIGGAFCIGVVDDASQAKVKRSLSARNIKVGADSFSRMYNTVKAGSKGAAGVSRVNNGDAKPGATPDAISSTSKTASSTPSGTASAEPAGGPDTFVTKLMGFLFNKDEATQMYRLAGITKNHYTPDKVSGRKLAETSEGSVQAAAAFAVNIQDNTTLAQVADGVHFKAEGGSVEIVSCNDVDAVISANASAAIATTAIGAAAAVNIVSYSNIARLGDARVTAASLLVRASSAEEEDKKTLDQIMEELVTFYAESGHMEALIDTLYGEQSKSFDELIKERASAAYKDDEDFKALPDDEKDALLAAAETKIRAEVISGVLEKMRSGSTVEVTSDLLGDVVEDFFDEIFALMTEPKFWIAQAIDAITGSGPSSTFTEMGKNATLEARVTYKKLRAALVTYLTARFNGGDELDGVGNRISTTAISGAGGANVGVAGALALAVINGEVKAELSDRASVLSSDIVLTGVGQVTAELAQDIYTTATASTDLNGSPMKNKSGDSTGGKSVGVGASVALNFINQGHGSVEAVLGENRRVSAAAFAASAVSRSDIDCVSVAGTDPIAIRDSVAPVTPQLGAPWQDTANGTGTKDIALDASVAVSTVTDTVSALIRKGAVLTLTGGELIDTGDKDSDNKAIKKTLVVCARETGVSAAQASGFACGNKAAVGAAVAVNIIDGGVIAELAGSAAVTGGTLVRAYAKNADTAKAYALVTGASLDRYLDKLQTVVSALSYGSTASTLNYTLVNQINKLAAPVTNKYQSTVGTLTSKLPFSQQLLKTLNVKLPGLSEVKPATDLAASKTGSPVEGQTVDQESAKEQSIDIAAAVGVNITAHRVKAQLTGSVNAGGDVTVESEDRSNYRTLGTGATVTVLDENTNAISVGVAVTVNDNSSVAEISGMVTTTASGGLDVRAITTQNMDDGFRGLLAAQSLAGAVSGKGGKVGAAGAASVLIADAVTRASVAGAARLNISGDAVIEALDKSKYAVRAGGLTVTGANVGVGAAFALIYAQNETVCAIEDGAVITARDLKAAAERQRVDSSDYALPFGTEVLFTVNVKDKTKQGLINITTSESESYDSGLGKDSIQVNLDTSDLLMLFDLMNYLSSVNYYIETIAGSVAAGSESKAAIAGGVSMLYIENDTRVDIGAADITLTGAMDAHAQSDITTRIIGGALSAAKAGTGVGINAAAAVKDDSVKVSLASGCSVRAAGDLSALASIKEEFMAITAGVAASGGKVAGGGAINGISGSSTASVSVGEGGSADRYALLESTGGNVKLRSAVDSEMILGSMSLSAAKGSAAVGGTVMFTMTDNGAVTAVGDYTRIRGLAAEISAEMDETLYDVLASLSAGSGNAVAGTLGVLLTESTAKAAIGNHVSITATQDDVRIMADAVEKQIVILATAGIGGGTAAAGATVNVNVFDNKVLAQVGDGCVIDAARSVLIDASAENTLLLITAAGSATTGSAAISGAIPVLVSSTEVGATVGKSTVITAGDSVGVTASCDGELSAIAGSVSLSGGTAAVGATVNTVVLENDVYALISDCASITGRAVSTSTLVTLTDNNGKRRRGVVVSAANDFKLLMASISGGAAGTTAVVGVISTFVANSRTRAEIGRSVAINAVNVLRESDGTVASGEADPDGGSEQAVSVEATDDSELIHIAGGLTGGGTTAVGVATAISVYQKQVSASIAEGALVFSKSELRVNAASTDTQLLLAVNAAVGGTTAVAPGGSALTLKNAVSAAVAGTAETQGNISITAGAEYELTSITAIVGASGSAAVSGSLVVLYFEGSTKAAVLDGARLTAVGDITVEARSEEKISADVAGVAVSGSAAVSGSIGVVITKVVTRTDVGKDALVTGKSVRVYAADDYELLSVAATVAVSGNAGVGVTAFVSVNRNTVAAAVGVGARVISRAASIELLADAQRNIRLYTGSAAGGQVGVSSTILVAVVGGRLDKDSAEQLMPSSSPARGLKPDEAMSGFSAAAPASARDGMYTGLKADLDSDDHRLSDTNVGGGDGFDASSGYRSDEFDSETYDDGTGSGRGSDFTPDDGDNKDISDAASLGSARPAYSSSDAVSATVGANALLDSAADIRIEAFENTNTDIITAALVGGKYAAVGAGVAVAVLYSNVAAYTQRGSSLKAVGAVAVRARAGASQLDTDTVLSDNKKELEKLENSLSSYTIRAISASGSGALAAVSVSVAAITLSSGIRAYIDGDVNARSLEVKALREYSGILPATLAIGGGTVGVRASVALALVNGTVESGIGGAAKVNTTGSTEVTALADSTAQAFAATLAYGGMAVNGALALVIDRARIDTYIGGGATVTADCVALKTCADMTADAAIVGLVIANGSIAMGLNAALVNLSATVLTYIGNTPDGFDANEGAGGQGGSIRSGAVSVSNEINTTATPTVLSFAGGSEAAVNGNALLAFNRSRAWAGVNRVNVTATALTVDAAMDASASSVMVSATASLSFAIGVSVSYVQLRADNKAMVDTTGAVISADSITIAAGRRDAESLNRFETKALALSGAVGMTAVQLNAAVADNDAKNYARLIGTGKAAVTGALNVLAYSAATAQPEIVGLAIGSTEITASVAVSLLRCEQRAETDGVITAGSVRVSAGMNETNIDKDRDTAIAQVFTGGGALYSYRATVAVAYGRSQNHASASGTLKVTGGAVLVESTGNAGVRVIIDNLALAQLAASTLQGYAYSQSVFKAGTTFTGSSEAGSVKVNSSYNTRSTARVTPSAAGIRGSSVDVSVIKVKLNIAVAVAGSTSSAFIGGAGTLRVTGGIEVINQGTADATAEIPTAEMDLGAVSIAANLVLAKLKAAQSAYLTDTAIANAESVVVRSTLNADTAPDAQLGETEPKTHGATAKTGASGGANVSLVGAAINVARADNDAVNSAFIRDARIKTAGDIRVEALGKLLSTADVLTNNDISLLNVGLMFTHADSNGVFSAFISLGTGRSIDAGSIAVITQYTAISQADVSAGGGVSVGISLVGTEVNKAESMLNSIAKAYITGSGSIKAVSALAAIADGTVISTAKAHTKKVTVSGLRIVANLSDATLAAQQQAYLEDMLSVAAGSVEVASKLSSGVDATSGGSGGPESKDVAVSLVGAAVNTASANSASANRAHIGNVAGLTAGTVAVTANNTTKVSAKTVNALSVSLAALGSFNSRAGATDSVSAGISGGSVTATGGDVVVNASGSAKVTAEVCVPLTVAGVSYQDADVSAAIGNAEHDGSGLWTNPNSTSFHTVEAFIDGAAVVTATAGNIDIKAQNTAEMSVSFTKDTSYTLSSLTKAVLPVSGAYRTNAWVGEDTRLNAAADISVRALSDITSLSQAVTSSIGVAVGDKLETFNFIKEELNADIHSAAVIIAGRDLTVQADAGVKQTSSINADSAGLVTRATLKSFLFYLRDSAAGNITVGDGAHITAGRNVTLLAGRRAADECGVKLTNRIDGSAAGLSGSAGAQAQTGTSLVWMIELGRGVTVEADGDVLIRAANDVDAAVDTVFNPDTLLGDTEVIAELDAALHEYIYMSINTGLVSKINGQNITVEAVQGKVTLTSCGESKPQSLPVTLNKFDVRAGTAVNAPKAYILIQSVTLAARDNLRVLASNESENGTVLSAKTTADAKGMSYVSHAETEFSNAVSKLAIEKDAALQGRNVELRAKFRSLDKLSASGQTDAWVTAAYTTAVDIDPSAVFYLGGSTMSADITVAADGTVSGIDNGYSRDDAAKTITISYLEAFASDEGKLTVENGALSGQKVYSVGAGASSLRVVNNSDYTLVFSWLTPLRNVQGSSAAVMHTLKAAGGSKTNTGTAVTDGSDLSAAVEGVHYVQGGSGSAAGGLTVTSTAGGGVAFTGINDFSGMDVKLLWQGAQGTLSSASDDFMGTTLPSLWAGSLSVLGNVTVGTRTAPVNVLLTENAVLTADVTGDMYLTATIAGLVASADELNSADLSGSLYLGDLLSGGDMELRFTKAARVYVGNDEGAALWLDGADNYTKGFNISLDESDTGTAVTVRARSVVLRLPYSANKLISTNRFGSNRLTVQSALGGVYIYGELDPASCELVVSSQTDAMFYAYDSADSSPTYASLHQNGSYALTVSALGNVGFLDLTGANGGGEIRISAGGDIAAGSVTVRTYSRGFLTAGGNLTLDALYGYVAWFKGIVDFTLDIAAAGKVTIGTVSGAEDDSVSVWEGDAYLTPSSEPLRFYSEVFTGRANVDPQLCGIRILGASLKLGSVSCGFENNTTAITHADYTKVYAGMQLLSVGDIEISSLAGGHSLIEIVSASGTVRMGSLEATEYDAVRNARGSIVVDAAGDVLIGSASGLLSDGATGDVTAWDRDDVTIISETGSIKLDGVKLYGYAKFTLSAPMGDVNVGGDITSARMNNIHLGAEDVNPVISISAVNIDLNGHWALGFGYAYEYGDTAPRDAITYLKMNLNAVNDIGIYGILHGVNGVRFNFNAGRDVVFASPSDCINASTDDYFSLTVNAGRDILFSCPVAIVNVGWDADYSLTAGNNIGSDSELNFCAGSAVLKADKDILLHDVSSANGGKVTVCAGAKAKLDSLTVSVSTVSISGHTVSIEKLSVVGSGSADVRGENGVELGDTEVHYTGSGNLKAGLDVRSGGNISLNDRMLVSRNGTVSLTALGSILTGESGEVWLCHAHGYDELGNNDGGKLIVSAGADLGSADKLFNIKTMGEGSELEIVGVRDIYLSVNGCYYENELLNYGDLGKGGMTVSDMSGVYHVSVGSTESFTVTQTNGDMAIGCINLSSGVVELRAAAGSIYDAGTCSGLRGQSLSLSAAGNIGSAAAPLAVQTWENGIKAAADGDIFLSTASSLSVNSITAGGNVDLTAVNGFKAVNGSPEKRNVTGKNITLTSYVGDIASAAEPLYVALSGGSLTVNQYGGGAVYIAPNMAFTLNRINTAIDTRTITNAVELFEALGGEDYAALDVSTGTVKLKKNTEISFVLNMKLQGGGVTLDLGGFTLTAVGGIYALIMESGELTIKSGTVQATTHNALALPTVVINGGRLSLTDISITDAETGYTRAGAVNGLSGTLYLSPFGGNVKIDGAFCRQPDFTLSAAQGCVVTPVSKVQTNQSWVAMEGVLSDFGDYSFELGLNAAAVAQELYPEITVVFDNINGSNVGQYGAKLLECSTVVKAKQKDDAQTGTVIAQLTELLGGFKWYYRASAGAAWTEIGEGEFKALGEYKIEFALTETGKQHCTIMNDGSDGSSDGVFTKTVAMEPGDAKAFVISGDSPDTEYGNTASIVVSISDSAPEEYRKNAVISYSLTGEDGSYTTENPAVAGPGDVLVYYRVDCGNYQPITGAEFAKLSQQQVRLVAEFTDAGAYNEDGTVKDSYLRYDGGHKYLALAVEKYEKQPDGSWKWVRTTDSAVLGELNPQLSVENLDLGGRQSGELVDLLETGNYMVSLFAAPTVQWLNAYNWYDNTVQTGYIDVAGLSFAPDEFTVSGFNVIYDGQSHSVTVEGLQPGDEVYYDLGSTSGGKLDQSLFTAGLPSFTELSTYPTVNIRIRRAHYEDYDTKVSCVVREAELNVSVEGYNGSYDGTPHPIIITGLRDGDIVSWKDYYDEEYTSSCTYSTGTELPLPSFTNANIGEEHRYNVRVQRYGYDDMVEDVTLIVEPIQIVVDVHYDGELSEPLYIGDLGIKTYGVEYAGLADLVKVYDGDRLLRLSGSFTVSHFEAYDGTDYVRTVNIPDGIDAVTSAAYAMLNRGALYAEFFDTNVTPEGQVAFAYAMWYIAPEDEVDQRWEYLLINGEKNYILNTAGSGVGALGRIIPADQPQQQTPNNTENEYLGKTQAEYEAAAAAMTSADAAKPLGQGGLGKPEGMSETEYRTTLDAMLRELEQYAGFGYYGVTDKLSVDDAVTAQLERTASELLKLTNQTELAVQNLSYGTRVSAADAGTLSGESGLRLIQESCPASRLEDVNDGFYSLRQHLEAESLVRLFDIAILRQNGEKVIESGEALSVSIRVQPGQRVRIWCRDESNQWRQVEVTADEHGYATVTVERLGLFALEISDTSLLPQEALEWNSKQKQ